MCRRFDSYRGHRDNQETAVEPGVCQPVDVCYRANVGTQGSATGGPSVILVPRLATMEFAAGPPSQWIVTLRSGAVMELAADAYTENEGHAVFSVLAEATPEEQSQVEVLDWRLAAPRVVVLVAKVPLTEIAKIAGGWPWGAEPNDVDPTALSD